MEKAEYRNSVRSRRLICDALLELMNEKPLKKITITDITKRADVNRGTFYLHYSGVSDAVNELQDTLILQMDQYFANLDVTINANNIMVITAECLKYVYEQNKSKYMSLFFHHNLSFANKVCKRFQERLLTIKDIPKDETRQKELIVRASLLTHGIIGVYHASADGVLDVPVDCITSYIDNLVTDLQYLQTQKKERSIADDKAVSDMEY